MSTSVANRACEADRTACLILHAARLAFFSRPYGEVRLRDLARSAGLSTGAIFCHFRDKADLFEAAMGYNYERFARAAPYLHRAVKALLPEGWGDDDTMDHLPGVKLARYALSICNPPPGESPPHTGVGAGSASTPPEPPAGPAPSSEDRP